MEQRLAAVGKRQHNSKKQKKCAEAGSAFLLATAGEKRECNDEKKDVCAMGPRRKGTGKQKLNTEAEQKKARENIMVLARRIRLPKQGGAANGEQSRPSLKEAEQWNG